jgi:hypothetical protein
METLTLQVVSLARAGTGSPWTRSLNTGPVAGQTRLAFEVVKAKIHALIFSEFSGQRASDRSGSKLTCLRLRPGHFSSLRKACSVRLARLCAKFFQFYPARKIAHFSPLGATHIDEKGSRISGLTFCDIRELSLQTLVGPLTPESGQRPFLFVFNVQDANQFFRKTKSE